MEPGLEDPLAGEVLLLQIQQLLRRQSFKGFLPLWCCLPRKALLLLKVLLQSLETKERDPVLLDEGQPLLVLFDLPLDFKGFLSSPCLGHLLESTLPLCVRLVLGIIGTQANVLDHIAVGEECRLPDVLMIVSPRVQLLLGLPFWQIRSLFLLRQQLPLL